LLVTAICTRAAALAIAIAVIEPISAALVAGGADQPFDIGFHRDLQHRLRHGSQEIATSAILSSVIGPSVGSG